MAAAVTLAAAGTHVTVYETARQLGGRARRVIRNGTVLDNGQHILIGAYRDTLAMLERIGSPPSNLLRQPLQWNVLPDFRFRVADLPAPWHLAAGLVRARGMSIAARIGCVRFIEWGRRTGFRLAQDTTTAELLRRHGQDPATIRCLWAPLCLAALNTPIEQASAQVFLNVLRDGLAADKLASELILPRVDLTALFPAPAADYLRRRNSDVRLGTPVRRVDPSAGGYAILTNVGETRHTALILATQPTQVGIIAGHLHALARPLAQIDALSYQPIVTIYLRYPQAPRLPFPMIGLAGTLTQWVFDRGAISAHGTQCGLIAAVISAKGRQHGLPHDELAQHVHAEIATAYPGLQPPDWTQVIEEKRATFACTPNLARPEHATPQPGLFLAGDYTASDYPATIEAAVRSGVRAAELAAAWLGRRATGGA